MQKAIYRIIPRIRVSSVLVLVLAALSGSSLQKALAFDAAFAPLPPVKPTLVQTVSFSLPIRPDARPPFPIRKPDAKGGIVRTTVIPHASAWQKGISAWRQRDYAAARKNFIDSATAENADNWQRAAGTFWAARATAELGNTREATLFLKLAALQGRTFYGLLANEKLGRFPAFDWQEPTFGGAHAAILQKHPVGAQAMALVSNGKLSAADKALLNVAGSNDKTLRLAALSFAIKNGLPATAYRLATRVQGETGLRYDSASYPMGGWVAEQDYQIDRALVHAIIRCESGFNPKARSGQGATGLMQLMPSTARYVHKVKAGGNGRGVRPDLSQSLQNLQTGQDYLSYLLEHPRVDNRLIELLMAYNAGPGNLAAWQETMADIEDPLLFMESIPLAETRDYVERVMAAYWIYRNRLGLANPTLKAMAEGRTAYYQQPMPWASSFKVSALLP